MKSQYSQMIKASLQNLWKKQILSQSLHDENGFNYSYNRGLLTMQREKTDAGCSELQGAV